MVELVVFGAVVGMGMGILRARQKTSRPHVAIQHTVRLMRDAPVLIERPGPYDAPYLAMALESVAGIEEELAALGFVTVGDLISAKGLPGNQEAVRVMASADGTVQVRLCASSMLRVDAVAFLSANEAGEEVITVRRRPGARGLARGPNVLRLDRPTETPLPEVLEAHRERARILGDRVAFHTLDDVLHSHAVVRGRTLAWRRSQDPKTLMEADLRELSDAEVPRAVVLPKR